VKEWRSRREFSVMVQGRKEISECQYKDDGSVGIALGYGLDDRGSIPGGSWEFFSSLSRPERPWCPPSLLSNEYQGLFPWG
jgi:hypothetical protein